MFIPRICWLLIDAALWICWHYLLTRQGKSFKGKLWTLLGTLCYSHQANISQVRRRFFYMWEIPFTLAFTYLYLSICIYLSIYFKIVWPQVCFSTCCRLSQLRAKSLFVGGLEIFPKNSSHRENSQTDYLYINKSLQKICCSFFKALLLMKVSA